MDQKNHPAIRQARVALIAAIAPDRAIGNENSLPWKLPRDLRHFRRITTGHVVIMGRRTFESFGNRPLPKRDNIVISRSLSEHTPGVLVARSLDDAIAIGRARTKRARIFVIGGGEIYVQTLPMTDEIFLSLLIQQNPTYHLFEPAFAADTFFPEINLAQWSICHISRKFIARASLKGPGPSGANLMFRSIKLVRANIGCTEAEKRKLGRRQDPWQESERVGYFNSWLTEVLAEMQMASGKSS